MNEGDQHTLERASTFSHGTPTFDSGGRDFRDYTKQPWYSEKEAAFLERVRIDLAEQKEDIDRLGALWPLRVAVIACCLLLVRSSCLPIVCSVSLGELHSCTVAHDPVQCQALQ
jgi:hypothetical protein